MIADSEGRFDVVIVGGGPAGLFGAFYAGLRGLRALIVESLDVLGGQVAAFYPEKAIYDVAGFPAVVGRALVRELVGQAMRYEPAMALGEVALRIARTANGG